MKRNRAFLKICDKIGVSPDIVSYDIYNMVDGASIIYGNYKILLKGRRLIKGKIRYHVLLYNNDILVTSSMVDII